MPKPSARVEESASSSKAIPFATEKAARIPFLFAERISGMISAITLGFLSRSRTIAGASTPSEVHASTKAGVTQRPSPE